LWGDAILISQDADRDEMDAKRMELETALNRLGEQADRLVQEGQPLARSAGGLGRWSLTGAVSLALYNALLVLGSPVILAILVSKKRCRPGLAQRLGKLPAELAAAPDAETLWVHAVSMGEVIAVAPLVEGLRTRYPRARILISTVTETGREMAGQRLAGQARHIYLPLDFPWVIRRVLGGIRPRILILVETELWPNLLRQAAASGVLTVLVNGRLSTESFQGYRWVRPLIRPLLR
jgi:3-deoxy-D-manno-octulosonic-acid transferase